MTWIWASVNKGQRAEHGLLTQDSVISFSYLIIGILLTVYLVNNNAKCQFTLRLSFFIVHIYYVISVYKVIL